MHTTIAWNIIIIYFFVRFTIYKVVCMKKFQASPLVLVYCSDDLRPDLVTV
jgi:hypothetical protein